MNLLMNDVDFYIVMEGVKFSEILLLVDLILDEYKKLVNLFVGDFVKMCLYVMGVDVWFLVNKFNELNKIFGYRVFGLIGVLSVG